MHKLESFSLSANAKIGKPSIEEFFFPILEDKFICVSTYSDEGAKSYDYFDDVIFHIKPFLDKNGISILQVGKPKDRNLFYCKPYLNTNRLHSSYIINKSLLYFGNYNLYTNIASYKNKKIVCPINIEYSNSIFPYWSNEDNCKFIQSNPDNIKPSLSVEEVNKTINEVKPEVIACQILDFLNIKHDLNKLETIHIGKHYANQLTEVVPFSGFDPNTQIGEDIVLRLDKSTNIESLPSIAHKRKLSVVIRDNIDINVLKMISQSISRITYFVTNKTKLDEITSLSSIGKPLALVSEDKKNINKIRLKFIDYDIGLINKLNKSDCGIKKVTKDMQFLSRKNIVSNSQIYNSYLSESKSQNTTKVEDNPLLWEDSHHIRIFKNKA
tara:strand:- start:16387 stop:17535 length:1149 start_codon:yes stop_codon:yes gene_type:complete